jgi:hypothetical protein
MRRSPFRKPNSLRNRASSRGRAKRDRPANPARRIPGQAVLSATALRPDRLARPLTARWPSAAEACPE